VDILQAAGLKWAPLLVAGPAYATPKWYRDSDRNVGYVCLEHNQESKIASLWNPQLRPWIDRFIKAFADRYRDHGVIELVRLGSTGTYRETLYPSGPVDGWTYLIPGPHHNHRGWWAGDRFAVASFRTCMRDRYRDIAALNRAWHTQYASFDSVAPMLPERAPSLRACLELVNWYLDSMTEFGAFWAATTRKYFPNTPVYQSLGGSGEPVLGADFSAQARALAPYGVRARVTNEGSDSQRSELLATPRADVKFLHPTVRGPAPRRFRLQIGGPGETQYLEGDWHGPENGGMFPQIPGARMRWTGAKAGSQTYRFHVSKEQLADCKVTHVALEVRTFLPREHGIPGMGTRLARRGRVRAPRGSGRNPGCPLFGLRAVQRGRHAGDLAPAEVGSRRACHTRPRERHRRRLRDATGRRRLVLQRNRPRPARRRV
jgi:hypothetical protein